MAAGMQFPDTIMSGNRFERPCLQNRGIRLVEVILRLSSQDRGGIPLVRQPESKPHFPSVGGEIEAIDLRFLFKRISLYLEKQLFAFVPHRKHMNRRRMGQKLQRVGNIEHRRELGNHLRGAFEQARQHLHQVRFAVGQRIDAPFYVVPPGRVDVKDIHLLVRLFQIIPAVGVNRPDVGALQSREVLPCHLEMRRHGLHVDYLARLFREIVRIDAQATGQVAQPVAFGNKCLLVTRGHFRRALFERHPRRIKNLLVRIPFRQFVLDNLPRRNLFNQETDIQVRIFMRLQRKPCHIVRAVRPQELFLFFAQHHILFGFKFTGIFPNAEISPVFSPPEGFVQFCDRVSAPSEGFLQFCDNVSRLGKASCNFAATFPDLGRLRAILRQRFPTWEGFLRFCDNVSRFGKAPCNFAATFPVLGKAPAILQQHFRALGRLRQALKRA